VEGANLYETMGDYGFSIRPSIVVVLWVFNDRAGQKDSMSKMWCLFQHNGGRKNVAVDARALRFL